jgi:hypothetical protein
MPQDNAGAIDKAVLTSTPHIFLFPAPQTPREKSQGIVGRKGLGVLLIQCFLTTEGSWAAQWPGNSPSLPSHPHFLVEIDTLESHTLAPTATKF